MLGLTVFAQPHDPGASPGEAVSSPWSSALCNRVHRDRTYVTELQNWCFLCASSDLELLCRCFSMFGVFMLSQTDTEGAFASFISKGLTVRVFLLQTGMVVSIFRSMVESSFFHSQIPSHQSHMVTFLLPNPLFSSPCRVLGQTVHLLPHPWKFSVPG